ncbi:hypothetical protein ACIGHF_10065 [Stenotrophomonas sp. NPDC077464]|uniref:hypothetical protein n=1 Tax=unclassified Stenotrophomonas TaxID=196198 RepID=UPI0037D36FA5
MHSIPANNAATPPANARVPVPPASPGSAGTVQRAGSGELAVAPPPAPARQLRLESIRQEMAYFGAIAEPLKNALTDAELQTSEGRAAALGRQLMFITNPCRVGAQTLSAFRSQFVDAEERGYALVDALPAPGAPLFGVGSLAYQTLLSNHCAPGNDGMAQLPLLHAARFLTLATEPK